MAFSTECLHFFLSTVVFILLCIAGAQALLLAFQERMLKREAGSCLIGFFPPLEKMERLLFILIASACFFLTGLLLTSGLLFYPATLESFWQKTLLSIVAWIILIMLLIGRHYFGWRGKVAIRWTLVGVSLIASIYIGALVLMPNY